MSHRVIHGDCTEVLRELARDSFLVDAVVTDPPYHLTSIVARLGSPDAAPIQSGATGVYARSSSGFMGEEWDGGDIAFRPETWRRAFDVMKPGAYLIAFASTKGYHRMVCAIEDAGFDIEDMVPWLYGTGFPKSHDQGEGRGTGLKPAIEPVVLAQKPISEPSIAANLVRWGVGALNIDACRIHAFDEPVSGGKTPIMRAHGQNSRPSHARPSNRAPSTALGRFPANLCHDGSDEVLAAFAEYGDRGAAAPASGPQHSGPSKSNAMAGAFKGMDERAPAFHGDKGSAARFFYSSKATQGERIFECRECGAHTIGKPSCGHDDFRTHPTVKPISLMRWYVEMVTPPGGLVLDPFAGTGTTGLAAREVGRQSLLIESKADHVRDIALRMGLNMTDMLGAQVSSTSVNHGAQSDLFGAAAA